MHTEIVGLNPISAHKCCPNTELICPEHQPYPEWSHQPLILQRYKLSMCRNAAAAALLPSHLQHCSMLMPHYKQYKHTDVILLQNIRGTIPTAAAVILTAVILTAVQCGYSTSCCRLLQVSPCDLAASPWCPHCSVSSARLSSVLPRNLDIMEVIYM